VKLLFGGCIGNINTSVHTSDTRNYLEKGEKKHGRGPTTTEIS
jgi:hypothetical protein